MKRTPEQILHSMDNLAADLMRSGLFGYARRLRGMRTEISRLPPRLIEPCDCGECAECERRDRRR
jgi:hypothetical protein